MLADLLFGGALFSLSIAASRRIAIRKGILAYPNPVVASHRAPVAYLGGTGLFVAYAGLLSARIALGQSPAVPEAWSRALGVLLFVALGTTDDLCRLRPLPKLLTQTAICLWYVAGIPLGSPSEHVCALMFLLLIVNAFNLIDVMDGLLCVLGGIAVLGLAGAPNFATAPERMDLWLLLVGILVLFAFNRPPAQVYSGDAGSLSLGFIVGVWCLEVIRRKGLIAAPWVFGLVAVPVLEVAFLVCARRARGLSPVRASPDHYALRLQNTLGWTQWRVLLASAAVASGLAMAPLAFQAPTAAAGLYAVVAVVLVAMAWRRCWRLAPSG